MNPLFEAAAEIQQTMQANRWPFCFIGGLAVMRWGEIRMTQDIDLCLQCGFGKEECYVKELITTYKSRVNDPLSFAAENRVLLLSATNGVPVDISLSGLEFEEGMIRRASFFPFYPGISLTTCSAEDLIVLKAFAERSKDWSDIEGIIMKSGKDLNMGYILKQLKPLCQAKEAPEVMEKLQNIFRENS